MSIDVTGKLFPNLATIIIQLLSTGVLLLVFKKYLWIPVQNYFAKRADYIETQMNEAASANEKAKKLMIESEEQAKQSALEYQQIVERAKADALKVRDDIVEQAKKEAASKIDQAQREIEVQKQQAREELKEEVVKAAIEVVSKVVNKEMDTQANKSMVEDFVEKVTKN